LSDFLMNSDALASENGHSHGSGLVAGFRQPSRGVS
jgi:hypothetical protein